MTAHKYILKPYKSLRDRHTCPACNKPRKFSRYIDSDTGEDLAEDVGRCERADNCGYHFTPKEFFAVNPQDKETFATSTRTRARALVNKPLPLSYIDKSVFEKSRANYEQNSLIQFLLTIAEPEAISNLIAKYHIGTSKHWPGSVVYWQIDTTGKIRSGKIMAYDAKTGKRVKEPFSHIAWVHKVLKLEDYNLQQTFFGAHLLKLHSSAPVAIVESEKTSLIASLYFPQFIWLACGSLNNLSAERCQVLFGRDVYLFPDLGKNKKTGKLHFELWSEKAKELSYIAKFTVSDILELHSTEAEKAAGNDIADWLIKYPLASFKTQQSAPQQATEPIKQNPDVTEFSELIKKANFLTNTREEERPVIQIDSAFARSNVVAWDIEELQEYFSTTSLPTYPLKLGCVTIQDVQLFISSHLQILMANNGNKTFLPYLERLQALKQTIETNHQKQAA